MRANSFTVSIVCLLFLFLIISVCPTTPINPAAAAQGGIKSINPVVKKIVDSVSEERIAEILKKLESFETRNTFSDPNHPTRGIGAARRWIYEQMKSYSPRLQVSFDSYRLKKQGRIPRDVELVNVVAVLPGSLNKERHFIVSGHYDSLTISRSQGQQTRAAAVNDETQTNANLDRAEIFAPGVTDDGSGTAAVMELARVMSQFEFEKTIVFIAFAGEEQGLIGSTLYAAKARRENQIIDGVLNNDIIGSEVSGNGRTGNSSVNIFSEDPNDSPARQLARYIKEIGERYIPSMKVNLIFRHDRFGRGGDHSAFNLEGYAAVRFTTPNENFANQHSATDTFANTSPSYTARVTKINAAVLASLALAPKAPIVIAERSARRAPSGAGEQQQNEQQSEQRRDQQQDEQQRGRMSPMIGRGRSGYDAQLRWRNPDPEPDLAGYIVVARATTAPYWEKEIFVGNVNEFVLENVSIDELVFGVKAVDKDGNESLVSAYVNPPRQKAVYETY